MTPPPSPSLLKLALLGAVGAGKRSLLHYLRTGKFYNPNGKWLVDPGSPGEFLQWSSGATGPLKLFIIWNDSGFDRRPVLQENFFKGTQGIIVVYDVTNRKSLDAVKPYVADAWKYIARQVGKTAAENATFFNGIGTQISRPILVFGNKNDLEQARQVHYNEGKRFAEGIGPEVLFFEGNCATGLNVVKAVGALVEACYSREPPVPP